MRAKQRDDIQDSEHRTVAWHRGVTGGGAGHEALQAVCGRQGRERGFRRRGSRGVRMALLKAEQVALHASWALCLSSQPPLQAQGRAGCTDDSWGVGAQGILRGLWPSCSSPACIKKEVLGA